MNDVDQTTFFYSRHPISADIILAKLQVACGHLSDVRPEELWPHDQDHYGGPPLVEGSDGCRGEPGGVPACARQRAGAGAAWSSLKPGGRLAFIDWGAHRPLSREDAALMWKGMAVQPLMDIPAYRALVNSAGFEIETVTDLSAAWTAILRERLSMYQCLRGEAERAGTPQGHDAFYRSYIRFVVLIEDRAPGGVRIAARRS